MPIGEEESIPLFMAVDCLLPEVDEGLLWRKLTIILDESAAISDPQQPLGSN